MAKSGYYCRCGYCGHEGHAYGTPHQDGVSAPWCSNCGCNDRLEIIQEAGKLIIEDQPQITISCDTIKEDITPKEAALLGIVCLRLAVEGNTRKILSGFPDGVIRHMKIKWPDKQRPEGSKADG